MQQVYHSNANTNLNIRRQLQNNSGNNTELASKFGISKQTVSKWKNRNFLQDASCKPLNIKYALTPLEKILAKSLRISSWVSLDEVWESLLETNSDISRSSVYRCFVAQNINQVPQEKKEQAKKFKEYEPGFLHIDVTYLPKFEGQANYLFVAIDRCTRSMIYKVYENKSADSTDDFMDRCLDFFPFKITHILTDNGLEFTNRLLKSKKGESCQKLSKMDLKCAKYGIKHRNTAPFTPKTNGMVERVNGTIKNNTILKTKYKSKIEMEHDLSRFLTFYNLNRRHGGIRKELKVKTPFNAVETWYKLKPEIFKITPQEFENKILNLNQN
ncbi:MAG: DDE-type integrase/transposase/recombinase [Flavobacteriaceae bacterium]|nr:DDE-type integrase/transposase/recombinase [Flavobacteriaceae bacterium]